MIFCVRKGVISRMRTSIKILFRTLSLEMIFKTFCMQLYIFLSSHCGDMNPGHVFVCVSEFESLMHCWSPWSRSLLSVASSISIDVPFCLPCTLLLVLTCIGFPPFLPPSSTLLAFLFLSFPWPSSPLTHPSPF